MNTDSSIKEEPEDLRTLLGQVKDKFIQGNITGWNEEMKQRYLYEVEEDATIFTTGYKAGWLEQEARIQQLQSDYMAVQNELNVAQMKKDEK